MSLGTQDAELYRLLREAFAPAPPLRLGVAVSGGSDSLALLHLLHDWFRDGGPAIAAVTVDHGLRPEAATEAAAVAAIAAGLGVDHDILHWQWDGQGNLPDRARRARLRLIADWARGKGIGTVALGHTRDDQAETFLMRLARGSGVDGLAGMAKRRRAEGVDWVRPVLATARDDLRAYLTRRHIAWFDDPTNADESYDRVKARKALAALAPLGIDMAAIAATAVRLAFARNALEASAERLARSACRVEAGDVFIVRAEFSEAPLETQYRILAHAIRWIASADYRPRLAALAEAHAALQISGQLTLGGCLLRSDRHGFRIAREFNAVAQTVASAGALWDRRWRVLGPPSDAIAIRALGAAGLKQCPDWRETGLPRSSLLASPSVWQAKKLLAAPLAGLTNGWCAVLACDDDDFFSSLITH